MLFLAAHDKLLTWKASLFYSFCICCSLFSSCLLSLFLYLFQEDLAQVAIPLWNFPWLSLRQSQIIPVPVFCYCERIYHNAMQSLALLDSFPTRLLSLFKVVIFYLFSLAPNHTRRSSLLIALVNKWLYLKDWSRSLTLTFSVILRNSLNFLVPQFAYP